MLDSVWVAPLVRGAAIDVDDRRREPRYAIANPPRVAIKVPPESLPIEASLVNISKNGIGLIAGDFVTPGLQIMFRFGDQYVFARVRRCEPTDGGFFIGAYIRDVVNREGVPGSTLVL